MWWKVLALIVGLLVGGITIAGVEYISSLLHPLPQGIEGLSFDDPEFKAIMATHVSGLPVSAFLMVLAAHFFGVCLGACTATLVAPGKWSLGAIVVGVFFLLAGLSSLMTIPHPTWFALTDLLLYLPGALLGYFLGCRLIRESVLENSATESSEQTDSPGLIESSAQETISD